MRNRVFALVCMAIAGAAGAQLSEKQVRDEYFAIKRLLGPVYSAPAKEGQGPLVAFDCGYQDGVDYSNADLRGDLAPAWARALLTTAKGVWQVRRAATTGRYPESSWRNALLQYEEEGLRVATFMAHQIGRKERVEELDQPAYPSPIVTSMRMFRSMQQPALPEVVHIEGCTPSASIIEIETQPAAGAVRLLPEFFARVCESERRDVESRCPYWMDLPQDGRIDAAGLFRYQVRWPDGASRSGRVDFDKVLKPNETVLFTITQ